MKRLLTFATAAALVVAASVAANAQRIAPRFDLGVYGGYGWTSRWFATAGDQNWGIGGSPNAGAQVTMWTTPTFGVRFNGTYLPTRWPHSEGLTISEDGFPLNNFLLDLEAVIRPWFGRDDMGNMMSSMYVWLGGGTMFTDAPGNPTPPAGQDYVCVPFYAQRGVCLSYEPGYAVVGQGTAGLGFDVFSLSNNIGFFAEAGAHGYDSPT